MALNKPLKALLLGSVAVSLAGAGAAHAGPNAPDTQFPSETYTPGSGSSINTDSTRGSGEQFPSDTYTPESGSNGNGEGNFGEDRLTPGSGGNNNADFENPHDVERQNQGSRSSSGPSDTNLSGGCTLAKQHDSHIKVVPEIGI
ncbi:MAG: hypothetical protein BRC58_07080 [Cyanobacteria bacterium QS_8_64_29]|nr:MAG: hypothetical protein BRC58_07080 [Cyanobacteria bacterium QS_8_64_29]